MLHGAGVRLLGSSERETWTPASGVRWEGEITGDEKFESTPRFDNSQRAHFSGHGFRLQMYPNITLTTPSTSLSATLFTPDAARGYYRSTRFDHGSMLGELLYDGHHPARRHRTRRACDAQARAAPRAGEVSRIGLELEAICVCARVGIYRFI